MTNIKSAVANLIANIQSYMLTHSGWTLVRDNPCRQRKQTLAQKRYFETFDYVRLAQLELITFYLEHFAITGDCAELGVYRGYFAQKIHEFLPNRKLYLFDTFEGFDQRDLDVENIISTNSGQDDLSDTSVEAILSLMGGGLTTLSSARVFFLKPHKTVMVLLHW
ncbi:MAG: hypothetical protein H8D23_16440 [Candidatus Brocadiales bacterium]|nr:hypothetical protein [Candidatus Brocadiales bacterium]